MARSSSPAPRPRPAPCSAPPPGDTATNGTNARAAANGTAKRAAREEPPEARRARGGLGAAFGSGWEILAIVATLAVLAGAPYALSGFWPVTRDSWSQSMALGWALLACLALALSGGAPNVRRISPVGWCLLGFAACNVASLAAASYKHEALIEVARLSAALVWFPIVRRLLFSSGPDLRAESEEAKGEHARAALVTGGASVGALVVCVLALAGFASMGGRQQASFYNANLFAFCVAVSLPLCASTWALARSLASDSKRKLVDAVGALAVAVCGAGLLVSYSKGGLLAAAIGTLVWLGLAWRARSQAVASSWRAHRRVALPALLVALVGLGAVAAVTVVPRIQRAGGSEAHSTAFRAYTWRATLAAANARPLLGHGPGSFPTTFTQHQQAGFTRSAHQSWLQIAAESGWPSLAFLLGAVVCGARNARKYLRDGQRPHRAWVAAGALAALAAAVVHGSVDAGWGILSIALLFCVALALLDAPPDQEVERVEDERRPLAVGWLALAIPLALLASHSVRAQSAESARVAALQALERGQREEALSQARRSTEEAPGDARAWFSLGQLRQSLGDASGARAAYERAIELQPARSWNHFSLARLLAAQGDAAGARKYLDAAVTLDPKSPLLRLERARFLESQREGDKAAEDYEAVVALADAPLGRFPAIPEIVSLDFNRARLALANRALQRGEKSRARELARRGLSDIELARGSARANPVMMQVLKENPDGPQPPSEAELAEQEAQFNQLLKRSG
jgi:tetratricopeptide (TPR) repeat protein